MIGEPHYLEIVTLDVDSVCQLYAQTALAQFEPPLDALGGARVAKLPGGVRLGVRAPMRDDEAPAWRVYLRVSDLDAAVSSARGQGAEIAVERMSLGDEHGDIAIVIQGGVEHGLWQSP